MRCLLCPHSLPTVCVHWRRGPCVCVCVCEGGGAAVLSYACVRERVDAGRVFAVRRRHRSAIGLHCRRCLLVPTLLCCCMPVCIPACVLQGSHQTKDIMSAIDKDLPAMRQWIKESGLGINADFGSSDEPAKPAAARGNDAESGVPWWQRVETMPNRGSSPSLTTA
eukprot:GHVU01168352.1.p1 GENE.GHVU01168352.1~~GHVU01168352.1.p1  ORF type:complete len:166 (+),score=3.53 GHVU01168352.1:2-499(+)